MTTKEKIFYASAQLFSEKCYADVSMRDIAAKVGIKPASIYNHYPSKQHILDQLFEFYSQRMLQNHATFDNLDLNCTPEQYFVKFMEIMTYSPEEIQLMSWLMRITYNEQFRSKVAADIIYENSIKKTSQVFLKYFQHLGIKISSSQVYCGEIMARVAITYAMQYVNDFANIDEDTFTISETFWYLFQQALNS